MTALTPANQLTLLRMVLIPVMALFVIYQRLGWAVVTFIVAALTDAFDGLLARRAGQKTTLGAWLDPVADKLLVAAALISLVQVGRVEAWIVVVIIGREFAITGLRGVSAAQGMVVGASDLGKYKTFAQYLAVTLLILEKNVPAGLEAEYVYLSRGMLWAALTLTVVSGFDYFVRFLRSSDIDALVKEDRWP